MTPQHHPEFHARSDPQRWPFVAMPPTSVRARRHVLRVLVIDDSEIDSEITLHWLGKIWPFERDLSIVVARTGEEALDRVLSSRFSFVILDWNLPQINGDDVLYRMRRYGVRLPVVVVSGLHRHELGLDIEGLGAAFLNKQEMDAQRLTGALAKSLALVQLTENVFPERTDNLMLRTTRGGVGTPS